MFERLVNAEGLKSGGNFKLCMYRIKQEESRVVCKSCAKLGYVDPHCTKCRGSGVLIKKDFWSVEYDAVPIKRISRDYTGNSGVGELLYFVDDEEGTVYRESEKILHFRRGDAQAECELRNMMDR